MAAKNVYVNVVDHRLIDNGNTVEDVTQVGLPSFEHPTTAISKVSGMSMDVDFPNNHRLQAADFSVVHNNGRFCRNLATPGKHEIEFRAVRQNYVVAEGDARNESIKFRMVGIHQSTEKGNLEIDSPYGSTDKYSLLRYEEEIDGEIVTIVDAMSGVLRWNGVDVNNEIETLLG